MAICGAMTKKGTPCQNPAGGCQYHGVRARSVLPPQVQFPARRLPSASTLRSTAGSRTSRASPTHPTSAAPLAANAGAAAILVFIAVAAGSQVEPNATWPMVLALVCFVIPAGVTSWYWGICGAWNQSLPTRCHRRRRGFFVRCHDHGGVTLYDILGAIWFIAGVLSFILAGLPTIQSLLVHA